MLNECYLDGHWSIFDFNKMIQAKMNFPIKFILLIRTFQLTKLKIKRLKKNYSVIGSPFSPTIPMMGSSSIHTQQQSIPTNDSASSNAINFQVG